MDEKKQIEAEYLAIRVLLAKGKERSLLLARHAADLPLEEREERMRLLASALAYITDSLVDFVGQRAWFEANLIEKLTGLQSHEDRSGDGDEG